MSRPSVYKWYSLSLYDQKFFEQFQIRNLCINITLKGLYFFTSHVELQKNRSENQITHSCSFLCRSVGHLQEEELETRHVVHVHGRSKKKKKNHLNWWYPLSFAFVYNWINFGVIHQSNRLTSFSDAQKHYVTVERQRRLFESVLRKRSVLRKNRVLTSDNTYQIKIFQNYSEYPIRRTAHCFSSNRRVSRSNHDVWLVYDNALIRRRTEVCTFPESCITTPTVFVDLRSEN